MPFPNQKVEVTKFSPPRRGVVIRQCEHDPHFWIVNVEGHGPERVRGRKLRPRKVKKEIPEDG